MLLRRVNSAVYTTINLKSRLQPDIPLLLKLSYADATPGLEGRDIGYSNVSPEWGEEGRGAVL